jgi:sugar phosphate isomerase/epimerase
LDEVEKRLGASGLKQLLSKHRLSLAAVTTYNLPPTRYARLLGELGGGLLVRESKYGKVTDLHGQMTAFLETLKPDLAAAEENNYRVAIENHRVALLDTLDSIRLFVEMTAPYPRLGIALAPYHLQAAKISVEDAIRAAGSKLFFIYAWQHAEGLAQLPGIGSADFRPWLNALTEIGYTGCTNAFMHGDVPFDSMLENLTKSRRYLESAL